MNENRYGKIEIKCGNGTQYGGNELNMQMKVNSGQI